ncbi:MAG: xylose isomerase [Actinomycetales bacterium]|nr:xylose isomerase [Actinomycetales bacterium]
MSDGLTPRPEHKFSFGLWTIGHPGRDPFGDATRPPIDPVDFVRGLAKIGAWGVSFHDDDLMTFGAPESQRRAELDRFKAALAETGIVCSMATTNLFWHPMFKDGAFTSNDRNVRRLAIQKVLRNLDVAAELGAPTYVLWGGREGVESAASKEPRDALDRYKEALDFLCGYVRDQGYAIRFALEPKPNEPRGDTFLPTIGHALGFIQMLEYPEMVGLNPEVAHETMAGLSFYQGVAQALWQGKLFHIDLNDQKIGRYDQDLRFGSEGIKDDFFLVRLLEASGYDGPRHFDARPYRNDGGEGIWDFARGCMRTYLVLAQKAREYDLDPRVQEAMAKAGVPELAESTVGRYSADSAARLKAESFEPDRLADRTYGNEALDQLVIDRILGV